MSVMKYRKDAEQGGTRLLCNTRDGEVPVYYRIFEDGDDSQGWSDLASVLPQPESDGGSVIASASHNSPKKRARTKKTAK